MFETTDGVEQITWYADGRQSPRRMVITFPNDRRERELSPLESMAQIMRGQEPQPGLESGYVEIFSTREEHPYACLGIDSPEQLMELAEGMRAAASQWRHCIGECGCDEESTDDPLAGMEVQEVSLEDLPQEIQDSIPDDLREAIESDGVVLGMASIPLSTLLGQESPAEEPESNGS